MKKLLVSGVLWGVFLGSVATGNCQVEIVNMPPPLLSKIELLGKNIFFDVRLSDPVGQACADCHAPAAGFTGPDSKVNAAGAVYHGAIPERFGNRKPPTAAYGGESPVLFMEIPGFFVGGMFWDGRATGLVTGDPLADQAMGPFLNDVEQNMDSEASVCLKVMSSGYAKLFEEVFGIGSLVCTQPEVGETYKNIARAIAAYERSAEVNPYSSKFDYWQRKLVNLNSLELQGWELFNAPNNNDGIRQTGEGGNCAACHPAPLFTDFTYDNLGVPPNPLNPFYGMDMVYNDAGRPINPLGASWIDLGLGGFLAALPADYPTSAAPWNKHAAENMGKQKVPTLRNLSKGIGRRFIKAYTHNGVFKSVKDVVHFYNTAAVLPFCKDIMGGMPGKDCWPMPEGWLMPEVRNTINRSELGDLGLTEEEEWAIVAFLRTLDDGYLLTRHKPKNRMKKHPTCQDLSGVDFGMCEMLLGYAVVGDRCQAVSGCGSYGYKFFPTLEECLKQCESDSIAIAVDPPIDGSDTYKPFEIINACITNTITVPIYLPGCSIFNLLHLDTGNITPEVICVWEGIAVELQPGEKVCTQHNSLYPTLTGTYQVVSSYGIGCTPGTPLSQCRNVKQLSSKTLPVACPTGMNCMPVVTLPNSLICGDEKPFFQKVCPSTMFVY